MIVHCNIHTHELVKLSRSAFKHTQTNEVIPFSLSWRTTVVLY